MNAKLSLGLLVSLAFAQIGGSEFANGLRAKYGPPLPRETFVVRPDFEMVVDYAANGHVCRIQVPPAPGAKDFLLELVPLTMRGKELETIMESTGGHSATTIRYENVAIREMVRGQPGGIMVMFRNEECRKQ